MELHDYVAIGGIVVYGLLLLGVFWASNKQRRQVKRVIDDIRARGKITLLIDPNTGQAIDPVNNPEAYRKVWGETCEKLNT